MSDQPPKDSVASPNVPKSKTASFTGANQQLGVQTIGEESPSISPAESNPDSPPPPQHVEPAVLPMASKGLAGELIAGRYRVLKKLGEGGMGIVYLAEHATIEKKMALKVLLHEYASKTDLKDRFLQEAKAAARIGHENIVDITDFGNTPDGSVFFAMEFLEGEDLAEVIKEGPIEWSRAKPILLQICRGLGAAHSKGIIHRDMKPENIFLVEREGRSDFVKVLDFGIAKMSMEQGEKRLTRTGMIFGTPEYMSPEQAQGNKPDHRVDIYAVGVIMYEMITGTVPFKADTFMGILTKHIFESPVPPSEVNPGITVAAEVETIILKAMAKDRDERFQSMTEMAAAITQAAGRMTRPTGDKQPEMAPRFISPTPVPSTPTGRGRVLEPEEPTERTTIPKVPKKRGARLALGLLGVLAVIGGGTIAMVALRGGESTSTDPTTKGVAAPVSPDATRAGEAPETTVSISVNSTPSGAAIYRGVYDKTKEPLGATPTTLKLEKSDRGMLITLRMEGYKDTSHRLVPSKDMEVVLQLEKVAAIAKPATIEPKQKRRPRSRRRPGLRPRGKKPPAETPPAKRRPDDRIDDLMNPFD